MSVGCDHSFGVRIKRSGAMDVASGWSRSFQSQWEESRCEWEMVRGRAAFRPPLPTWESGLKLADVPVTVPRF